MTFAIRTHKGTVAWHFGTPAWGFMQVGKEGNSSLLFLFPSVHEEFRGSGSEPRVHIFIS
jgi:hypothetical protein